MRVLGKNQKFDELMASAAEESEMEDGEQQRQKVDSFFKLIGLPNIF
jgi:hypothetical protein